MIAPLLCVWLPLAAAPAEPVAPVQGPLRTPGATSRDLTWQAQAEGAQARDEVRGWVLTARGTGLEVRPVPGDATEPEGWTFGIGMAGFGRLGAATPTEPGAPRASNERVEIDHGALSEWFVRNEHGVEHGWTIPAPPEGDEKLPLWIGLRVEGDLSMHIVDDGSGAFLRDATGVLRLRYGHLKTYDATGAVIPSRISPSPWGVGIQIDDSMALYPITVDPVLMPAAWELEFDQDYAADKAITISAAGDVNGDGYSDVIIGIPSWNGTPGIDEGQVWVFHGSSSGPSFAPDWTALGGSANGLFGHAACGAGDLNGDGYDDIAITARSHGNGKLYVFYGGPGGLGPAGSPANADFTYEFSQPNELFDSEGSLHPGGDLDGDGYDDLLAGARRETVGGATNAGRVYAFFGGAGGIVLGASNPWSATPFLQPNAEIGFTLSSADFNADGYPDVLVDAAQYSHPGQLQTGRAAVYMGGAGFRSDTTVDLIIEPPVIQNMSYFGNCRALGDFDGDGFADAMISAAGFVNGHPGEGAAWLFLGGPGGLSSTPTAGIEGNENNTYLGGIVGAAGDVDGDGYADAILSVSAGSTGARLYFGGPAGTTLTTNHDQYLPNSTGNAAWVSGLGDVNNDGFCDIAYLDGTYSNGHTTEGKVYLHFGSPNPLTSPQPGGVQQALLALGLPAGGTAGSGNGRSVSSAGDVNADGYNDVIVGSPEFGPTQNGRVQVFLGSPSGVNLAAPYATLNGANAGERFGWSVSAGDVDNDGRSDIVVGAPRYSNGQVDEGRVYLFRSLLGSISTTPAWSFESNEAGALFGSAVSALGDVNADGFADIAAGAPGAMASQGSVTVFHGRGTLLGSIVPDVTLTSGVPGSEFGTALALVGDVNLDGFTDLAVGAPKIDNPQVDEGRIYVYLGGYEGISSTVAGSNESQEAGALLGSSIAACGDINGDGRAEILAGAPGYQAATSGGAAFVYQAQPAGMGVTLNVFSLRLGLQANSQFGHAVSAGGDVNGDGWNDVLVGAPDYDGSLANQGRIYLYLGSSSTIASTPSETYDGPSAGARFGESIALGGDVNGDGLSDPIGGIPSANGGDGGALLMIGGGNTSWRVSSTQRVQADAQALQLLGRTNETNQYQITMGVQNASGNTATAMGRADVRLQWENDLFNSVLDGIGVQQQSTWTDSGALGSGLRLVAPITGLVSGNAYHWRARTLVRNPYYPHTRWTTIQLNAVQEKKLGLSGDCNGNGIADALDIQNATSLDCNGNTIPDECDIASGTSLDCNSTGTPDECDLVFNDCNNNQIPDDCEPDCNGNFVADECDVTLGISQDTNGDLVPDECQLTAMNPLLYCFGDGSGAACPCGNTSPAGQQVGCLSSLGTGGRLRFTGIARVQPPHDNFTLVGDQMPNSSALYFQATAQQSGGAGLVFGDGLRCATSSVIRLGTKINSGGASQYPVGTDLPVSIRGMIPAPGGTRYYQCWYRNAAAFCTAFTFNLTNGLRVTWIP